MANITERVNKDGSTSYLIRAFLSENKAGEQKVRTLTWRPAPGMTSRQIEKELKRQSALFEEKARCGLTSIDGSVKFEDYATHWIACAQLSPKSQLRYTQILERINAAIGHISLSKLQPQHLQEFYKNLQEDQIRKNGSYTVFKNLNEIMAVKGVTRATLARAAGISPATVTIARKGDHVSLQTAQAIVKALDTTHESLYEVHKDAAPLSDQTVMYHHRVIASILSQATREQIIPRNIASRDFLKAPKVQKKEPIYLNDIQAQKLMELLDVEEDIRKRVVITLLLFTGVRRGELCGLSWEDIDYIRYVVHVLRASQYLPHKGINEVPTKNESSKRAIKLPAHVFDMLVDYQRWWNELRFKNDDQWRGQDNRLFVQDDGTPINPDTINFWLDKFIEKNQLAHFTPHSLRHTFATLQIAAGVDLRAVQARTGHAQMSTLTNTYTHSIKTANEAASDALDDMLKPKNYRKAN